MMNIEERKVMDKIEYAELHGLLKDLYNRVDEAFHQFKQELRDAKVPAKDLLYAALAQAKLEYKTLRFNRTNAFNKQVYADLEAIQKATDHALSKAGLTFIQAPIDIDGTTYLDSILGHSSGQELSYRNRLIIPGYTGAASDNQRYGESLAYLKRQVAQAILGIVACNDEADNDDAQASEVQFNAQARKAIAGDEAKATVDQGILSERISKDQLEDLYYELQDYPVMTKALLKGLDIAQLADMPKAKFHQEMRRIREQKMMLRDKPQKDW
jgi:ERF superfamily